MSSASSYYAYHKEKHVSLDKYSEKRTFNQTPEPAPSKVEPRPDGRVFCVQRHDARALHYDLRIEVGGTLKSWAVPHGPTLDPKEKRLAVMTEDHPLEYATFEGNIPKGNYGAGSMMLWDLGTYEPLLGMDADKQIERGDFKFRLYGQKLKGEFALVRMKTAKATEWLLLKKKDAAASTDWTLDAHACSVKTGRTQEEVAMDLAPRQTSSTEVAGASQLPEAKLAAMPTKIEPMLAQIGDQIPEGGDWSYEIKWDGVRALAFIKDQKVHVTGRKGTPIDAQYPEVIAALGEAVKAKSAIIDGEVAALDDKGRPSFERIQPRIMNTDAQLMKSHPVIFFAFDLLYLDGYDLRDTPLSERKRMLSMILQPHNSIRYSQSFDVGGRELYAAAKAQGLEGILAKRRSSRYVGARSKDWLKFKTVNEQEFILCGFTEGERDFFGALVLGCWEEVDGKARMHCAGTVGTGFDRKLMQAIHEKLVPLITKKPPFIVPAMVEVKRAIWVRPEIVCTVRYLAWTNDGRLRAPVFVALRPDIDAKDCWRNPPVDAAETTVAKQREPLLPAGSKIEVTLTIDDKRLKFTSLNKLYYPKDNVTKRDVINYYDAVADLLIPYWTNRPLSMRRYPEGIEGEGFFQKHAEKGFPPWMRVQEILAEDGNLRMQIIGQGRAELLFLANFGCIDQNPWMSRVDSLDHPDFILVDLDPHECGYDKIVEAAHCVRRKLEQLGLESFPKTTGGDGMHLYIPVEAVYSYEQTRSFAEIIARLVAAERPDLFTTPRAVARRDKGKVYFDYLQNGKGKTISGPYVLRAYPGAPVATPLEWREVKPGLTPGQFHIGNAIGRFDRVGDLFEGVTKRLQRIETAMDRLPGVVAGPK